MTRQNQYLENIRLNPATGVSKATPRSALPRRRGGKPPSAGLQAKRGRVTEKQPFVKHRAAMVSSGVYETIGGVGHPLEPATRAFMEPRFGQNFSRVRVHSDGRAAKSARAINASAYTVGDHIVFGQGQYAPRSTGGKTLIAHELAHVVQQSGASETLQSKLTISKPAHSAEQAANWAARIVTAEAEQPKKSAVLAIRERLRKTSPLRSMILRQVTTWGGQYKPDKYDLLKTPGRDGVNMELRFIPNKHVDAELIGMVQTARSIRKGGPVPASVFYTTKAEKDAFESYRIKKGPHAGTMIDQTVENRNPLYVTGPGSAKYTLATTPVEGEASPTSQSATFGQHGWHYTDKAGNPQNRDALLKDTPWLPSAFKESSQTFETTALAVKGVQVGTYYGSVQWGWQKNVAGKVSKLPLKRISNDVPSAVFAQASKIWNKAKTAKGETTLDLPIVTAKYTNTPRVWLVSNPSTYKSTIIGKLTRNTRLEVTNKGTKERFNRTTDKYKWWKVTVVEGTHIGKVGWVMQVLLSDKKTK